MLLHKLPFGVLGQHFRIVPAGNAGHRHLDSFNNPSCHASSETYCKEFLAAGKAAR